MSKINFFRFALCVEKDTIIRNSSVLVASYDTLAMLDFKKASTGAETNATGSTAINSKKASLEP